jgi:hypothetical protein
MNPSRPGQSTVSGTDVDESEPALEGALADEEDDDTEQEHIFLNGNDEIMGNIKNGEYSRTFSFHPIIFPNKCTIGEPASSPSPPIPLNATTPPKKTKKKYMVAAISVCTGP